MQLENLQTVFIATVLSKLLYCSAAWWGFTTVEEQERLEAFLRKAKRANFCSTSVTSVAEQCSSIDNKLFQTVICNEQHVLHRLLPPKTNNKYSLRPKAHDRQLSAKVSSLYQCNFLQRMLFKDIY